MHGGNLRRPEGAGKVVPVVEGKIVRREARKIAGAADFSSSGLRGTTLF
jgi:hypothetical protein